MRLLLTRPREDAEPLAAELRRAGHEVLIEPMLEIRPLPDARLDLGGVQAALLTSANGARALAAATARRDLPVCAVGDATARAARSAGFADVASADGDVGALAALVRARLDPAAGRLLHVAGSAVAGDLSGALADAGFAVDRAVLYEARKAAALSPACRAALKDGRLDAALFFSPRSAAAFVRLADTAGLAGACRRLSALCLSRAVADAAGVVPWRGISVAIRPTQADLLDLLRESGA